MNLLGYDITIRKKAIPASLQSVSSQGGWWPVIRESFTGAWQQNVEVSLSTVLQHPVVYACLSLISADVSKLRMRLVRKNGEVWEETESAAFSPLLRQPNRFQTPIQFFERWMLSKLIHGNTYALKARDNRQVVTALYLMDPTRTTPLVAPDGSVFYRLKVDYLTGVSADVIVPASEIIHDRMNCIFHDLVGISPIYSCGLSATQGLAIQDRQTLFFENGSTPGGIVMVPGNLTQGQIDDIKTGWQSNYGGDNQGTIAVLSAGMTYTPINMVNNTDAQLAEQLKISDEHICTAFLVPRYKVGVGDDPAYNNIQALNTGYYATCIQRHTEAIESALDEGLGLLGPETTGIRYRTDFDLDDLLRMDTLTLVETLSKEVGAGITAPNEARERLNYGPATGGESPMIQQQNWSLEDLAKRSELGVVPKPIDNRQEIAPADAPAPDAAAKARLVLAEKAWLREMARERILRAA